MLSLWFGFLACGLSFGHLALPRSLTNFLWAHLVSFPGKGKDEGPHLSLYHLAEFRTGKELKHLREGCLLLSFLILTRGWSSQGYLRNSTSGSEHHLRLLLVYNFLVSSLGRSERKDLSGASQADYLSHYWLPICAGIHTDLAKSIYGTTT